MKMYCKTSNRRATKNSRIFEIAKQLMPTQINAVNNSCNQTINVANISGRVTSIALYIYCIYQLILAFVQCKNDFLGFKIMRSHDYDPELGTSYAFVVLYVICHLSMWLCYMYFFLEFDLGRAHTYFTRNAKVKTFMHEYFRDAVRNCTIFSRIRPNMHQFFSRFLKKFALLMSQLWTYFSKIN